MYIQIPSYIISTNLINVTDLRVDCQYIHPTSMYIAIQVLSTHIHRIIYNTNNDFHLIDLQMEIL